MFARNERTFRRDLWRGVLYPHDSPHSLRYWPRTFKGLTAASVYKADIAMQIVSYLQLSEEYDPQSLQYLFTAGNSFHGYLALRTNPSFATTQPDVETLLNLRLTAKSVQCSCQSLPLSLHSHHLPTGTGALWSWIDWFDREVRLASNNGFHSLIKKIIFDFRRTTVLATRTATTSWNQKRSHVTKTLTE